MTRSNLSHLDARTAELLLFAGLLLILIIATALGQFLAFRQRTANAVTENLNVRVFAWWVMVATIAISFQFGKLGVIILFAFVSFNGLREIVTVMETRRGDHWALALAFFGVLPLQYYLIAIDWYGLYSIFVPVYVFLLMPIVAVLRADTTRFLERIAEMQWGLMISVYCISHIPALMMLPVPGYEGKNLLLIAFLVIVVQSSDVLQYVWGKSLGRTLVAPTLSPAKTWEGLIGGVTSSSLLGMALWWITPFNPLQAGLFALLVSLVGFFGGLVMSAIKRDRNVKDWGHLIPGHGGMLDRVDSVLFAAPIFFHLVRYYWTI